MKKVLHDIWSADGMDKTCVMLSTLLPIQDELAAKNRLVINDQYRALVTELKSKRCIYLADMAPNGREWFNTWDDFYAGEQSKTHPNVSSFLGNNGIASASTTSHYVPWLTGD